MTNDISQATNQQKRTVGIFFGGKSAEHEVSINSAKNVLEALDKDKYLPRLIGIDINGLWHDVASTELISNPTPQTITNSPLREQFDVTDIDVTLPILHGPMGEDGTIQGFFELAGIPYVGPGVMASAVSMDKDVMKRLLRDAGIAIAPFKTLLSNDDDIVPQTIFDELGKELFVKPANMGSSVGVNKATTVGELQAAITEAFKYDTKILIESAIIGDEIECAVLGNEQPKASVIGRIVPKHDNFYSYDAKYVDDDGALLEIPAKIANGASEAAREIAVTTYKVLGCEGMSRVDMFLTPEGNLIVNEVNTIPGFTKISMYPKMWEATGLPYGDLVSELIDLAIDRFEHRVRVQVSH